MYDLSLEATFKEQDTESTCAISCYLLALPKKL